jgi:endonuclease G
VNRLLHLLLLLALSAPLGASAAFDDCRKLFPEEQVPVTLEVGRDLCFDDFAIYYSPKDKKPIYTVERLNGRELEAPRPKRSNQFYEEARLPTHERSLLADYRGSGFDRGHNVPAGDMTRERGMAQSFSLANMMPQARQNNQGIWAKRVEEATRMYAKRAAGDLYVYTGSTGSLGSIGKSKVTVPAHLFKLVYDPHKQIAWAYWVENQDSATVAPLISYAELVDKTGIDFQLPAQVIKNSAVNTPISQAPASKPVLGGWYPLFFDQYSAEAIEGLIVNIKAGKVAQVQIQYDRNLELAQRLAKDIEAHSSMRASLIQASQPDTSSASYEHNRVVILVRTR